MTDYSILMRKFEVIQAGVSETSAATLVRVRCEICGFILGIVDALNLFKPLTGAMFHSISPSQFPDPFPPTVDWQWMRCPMCNKRPFQYDDRVMSVDGKVIYACQATSATPREPETPTPEPEAIEEDDQPEDIKVKGNVKRKRRTVKRANTASRR